MGAACARALASRGWRVSLMARGAEVEALARELGGIATRGDILDEADLARAVRATLDAFGRIDGVVNWHRPPARELLLALTDADWSAGLDLVLMNVVRMRASSRRRCSSARGSIVNVSTYAAFEPDLRLPDLVVRPRGARELRGALCGPLRRRRDPHEQPGLHRHARGRRGDPRDDSARRYGRADEIARAARSCSRTTRRTSPPEPPRRRRTHEAYDASPEARKRAAPRRGAQRLLFDLGRPFGRQALLRRLPRSAQARCPRRGAQRLLFDLRSDRSVSRRCSNASRSARKRAPPRGRSATVRPRGGRSVGGRCSNASPEARKRASPAGSSVALGHARGASAPPTATARAPL